MTKPTEWDKNADVKDRRHVFSSFMFRISAFHNGLNMCLSMKYGFVPSFLTVHLGDYQATWAQISLKSQSYFRISL